MIRKKIDKGSIGTCQFCGEPIREFKYGWGCTGPGCGSMIFRDDKFFKQVIKRPMNRSTAVRLLMGDTMTYYGVDIHGVKHDIVVGLGYDRSGQYKYRYTMNYLDYDKKKDPNLDQSLCSDQGGSVTGFDVLNGD